MIRLIYVAGRYRAPTFEGIAQNISAARKVGVAMAKMGWYPVIPHCNTAHMELNTPGHGDDFWLAGTLELMTRCDAVVLVPGWESSEGTKGEVAKARELRLPVFELLDHVPLASEFEPVVTTTSDKYRAELYDEVWQLSRDMGCGNVANALGELAALRSAIADPEAVLTNMMRGTIAKPSLRSMLTLFGEVFNTEDAANIEIATLRARLQELESQEPVAWMHTYRCYPDDPRAPNQDGFDFTDIHQNPKAPGIENHTPLYAAPVPAPSQVAAEVVQVPRDLLVTALSPLASDHHVLGARKQLRALLAPSQGVPS